MTKLLSKSGSIKPLGTKRARQVTLGISESNLRVRLHRARQALRQRLEESCRTCPIHGYLDRNCDYCAQLRTHIGQDTPEL